MSLHPWPVVIFHMHAFPPAKIAFTVEQSLEPKVLKRTCLSCKASRDAINTEQSKKSQFDRKEDFQKCESH